MAALMANNHGARRSLLTLPPEVIKEILRNLLLVERNRVYQTTWGGMDWPYPDMARDSNEFREWWVRVNDMANPTTARVDRTTELRWARGLAKYAVRLDLAILRVCKTLHEEGVKILLQENKFVAVFGMGQVARVDGMKWPNFWSPSWRWDAENGRFLCSWYGQETVVNVRPVLSLSRQGAKQAERNSFNLMPAADLPCLASALAAEYWDLRKSPADDAEFKLDLTIRANARPSDFGGNNQGGDDIIDYLTPRLFMWVGESVRHVSISVSDPDTVGDDVQICVDLAESIIGIVQAWNRATREKQVELFIQYVSEHLETINSAVKDRNLDKADRAFCRLCEDLQALRFHPAIKPTSERTNFESISLTDLLNGYWTIFALACHSLCSLIPVMNAYPRRFRSRMSFVRWAIMRAEIPISHLRRDREWHLRAALQSTRLLIDAGCTRWVVYNCIHTAAKIIDVCLMNDPTSGRVQRIRDLKRHIPSYNILSLEPASYHYPHPRSLTSRDLAGIEQLATRWTQEVDAVCGDGLVGLSQFQGA
ncbi:hypothetical protein PV08_01545 [Exophiala spinifera]|uniref:Uncharacterized protein n=1 Tax=Exophiala spinifera TaxID=91928 RepID=A0A0D1Z086_9EURO|nr:uncharacterized protein PV08_01545 [Exophiala spinifera]KIW20966.1 hypothetical protein PV08_01545 [Exophiala spinifera]